MVNDQCVTRAVRRRQKRGRATECALPAHARPLGCDLAACSHSEGLVGGETAAECRHPPVLTSGRRARLPTNLLAAGASPQACHQDLHLIHGVEQSGACDLLSRHRSRAAQAGPQATDVQDVGPTEENQTTLNSKKPCPSDVREPKGGGGGGCRRTGRGCVPEIGGAVVPPPRPLRPELAAALGKRLTRKRNAIS